MARDDALDLPQPDLPFEAGISWEADKERRQALSERRAWTIAACSMLITLAAVIGMAMLAPLRRTVPYLFVADKATGNVEYVGAVDDRTLEGYQELLDKHWAGAYVVSYESYFYKLLQLDYDTVVAMSDDETAAKFARIYEGANARDKKYSDKTEVTIGIISIHLSANRFGKHATVRFSKTARRQDSDSADPSLYYVANFSYEYKPSMFGKEIDLFRNPLGFKVSGYRVDAELPPTGHATTRTAPIP